MTWKVDSAVRDFYTGQILLQDDIVNVKLPKFNIKSHLDLAKPLKQLGLTDILNKDTPDLGLMAPTDDIKISSLHHR